MIALLLNHLWQSSLCLAAAGLIVLALRGNSAHVRFWVWFAASLKFLVPFAALTAFSTYALAPMVPPITAPTVRAAEPLAKPFSAPMVVQITAGMIAPSGQPAPVAARRARSATVPVFHLNLEFLLLGAWAAGVLWLAVRWVRGWLRVRALVRGAVDAPIAAPVAVKYSSSHLEPGLVGILAPVILLPQDIAQELSPEELKAVLAHELCHWRRRDNLLAAIHMTVEALFWFFPLVWWLGRRLNSERERACDESVLAGGNDPQVYTHGILKVCSAYLQSPLACVAGVSGGGLKARISTILENRLVLRLGAFGRLALSSVAIVALAFPVALGLLTSPVAQSPAKASPERSVQGREADTLSALSQSLAGPSESQPAAQPEQPPAAPIKRRAPFHLRAERLSFPSPDWSHLLSPVSPDLFVSNDAPPAAAPQASSAEPAPVVAVQAKEDQPSDTARPESAVDRLRLKQATEARTFCEAQDQGPSKPEYPRCVNHFLQTHYGWQVGQRADGSLGVSVWTHGLAQHF
jgi:beta-lactamase regulating signal transducer with metallopeptidase domain